MIKKPSPAMVVATLALVAGSTGTSYAVSTLSANSVKSSHIKNGQVKSADLGTSAVSSTKVKDGSLLAKDFKSGQLPQGPKGDTGAAGAPGAPGVKGDKGDPGTPGATTTVVRRSEVTVNGNSFASTSVGCEAGERLTGGGAGWNGGGETDQVLRDSGPVDANGSFAGTESGETPAKWFARFQNGTVGAETAYVWAICAQ